MRRFSSWILLYLHKKWDVAAYIIRHCGEKVKGIFVIFTEEAVLREIFRHSRPYGTMSQIGMISYPCDRIQSITSPMIAAFVAERE